MKKLIFRVNISILIIGFAVAGCSSEDVDTTANNIVACRLDDFNQCFEWINVENALVDSLSSTCVIDDNGVIVDSCSTDNLIGICEELNDPGTPFDLLNHFYLSQPGIDPVDYENIKKDACIDVGGVWDPVN